MNSFLWEAQVEDYLGKVQEILTAVVNQRIVEAFDAEGIDPAHRSEAPQTLEFALVRIQGEILHTLEKHTMYDSEIISPMLHLVCDNAMDQNHEGAFNIDFGEEDS